MKWVLVKNVGEDSPPPSSKRTKPSSSNAYTTSYDAQYPLGFPPKQQSFNVENPPPQRKRKGKKAKSTLSTQNEIFDLVNEIAGINTATKKEVEQRQRYRKQKLHIFQDNEEGKAKMLEREIENHGMQYFLQLHDHLTGDDSTYAHP
ncbi:unnamed protein product [Lactuca virosa]|uniref:No apical meristem-associated C-terminal domain-containing protein n=1 Tax=Lactuca virosa TaxID=75947 RepID=A0AAU9MXV1_9ASTR|nr:unnamed protein product [Lactuca virosa]